MLVLRNNKVTFHSANDLNKPTTYLKCLIVGGKRDNKEWGLEKCFQGVKWERLKD